MQRAEKVIEVDAPLERVFDLFSDFESFPKWMNNVREVRYTGRGLSHWIADAPLGSRVEWEAETTIFEPDHRIAWRSLRGDVYTDGEVIFEETRRGTTLMRVVLGYDPPAGRLGALVAGLFGKNPQQQLDEDLERFAEVAEGRTRRTDRRRVERPPAAVDYGARDRGARGRETRDRGPESRESRESETRESETREGERSTRVAGPADERREYLRAQVERRRREAYDEETGRTRRDERGGYAPRSHRLREELDRDGRFDYGAGASSEERRSGSFGRPERHARQEQDAREGRDERERQRWANRPDEEDERLAAQERRRRSDARATRGEDDVDDALDARRRADAPQRNHAMTPREREAERTRRRPDGEYSNSILRRGVDRLMDEPPSRRWRRWENED